MFVKIKLNPSVYCVWGRAIKVPELPSYTVGLRVVNRIKFHFPVSECYNRVNNIMGNIAKILG